MAERSEHSIEDLLPGYTLNALTVEEHAAVERALEREPRLQSMLAVYLEGVGGLGDGHEPRLPPQALLGRVLGAIEAETAIPAMAQPLSFRASIPRSLWGVAAALVLAVVGVGATAAFEYQRVGELEDDMQALVADNGRYEERLRQQSELAMLAIQPGVQQAAMVSVADPVPTRQMADGVILSNPDGRQVLWLMHLEDLPVGYTYQAWLMEGADAAYSMAVFMPDADGQAMIDMWMPDHATTGEVWMTINVEREGGAVVPSANRVLAGRIH
jgi:anti-sigma-K factor RskA